MEKLKLPGRKLQLCASLNSWTRIYFYGDSIGYYKYITSRDTSACRVDTFKARLLFDLLDVELSFFPLKHAKVSNGTRWGGGAALGVAELLEAPSCASLVLVLLDSSVTVLRQVVQVKGKCSR